MAANNYQFIQTRNMFRDYLTGYPTNPTYEDWKNADAEDQVALLFVTFFTEINRAWYEAVASRENVPYVTQEDGIETVLQYLTKNVPNLLKNPNLYCGKYIHRVSYNCMGCLYRPKSANFWGNAESDEVDTGNEILSIWDIIPTEEDDFETQQTKEAIWAIIRHMGPKAEKVVNHLINPEDTLAKVSKKSKAGAIDRLADVCVNEEEFNHIVKELKIQLAPFKDAVLNF